MSIPFLDNIFGNGVEAAAKGIGGLAVDIRQSIKGKEADPDKQLEQAVKLVALQAEINKAEAESRNTFIAGWRPFIGYVCGIALLYHYIIRDLIIFSSSELEDLPIIEIGELNTILMGLLGLGGLRTYEKIKGASK